MNLRKFTSTFFYDSKNIVIFFIFISIFLVVDTSLGIIPDFITEFILSSTGISLFIFITLVTITGIIWLQNFVSKDNVNIISKSKYLSNLLLISKVINGILISNLCIVIVSILLFSKYSTINLLITNNIMAIIGSLFLIILALKFINWYISDRSSIILLIYGFSFIIFAVSFFFGYFSENLYLLDKPVLITPSMEVVYPISDGDPFEFFYDIYTHLIAISLFLFLVGSYILLNNYLEKVYRLRLIVTLVISFVLYIVVNLDSYGLEIPNADQSLVFLYLIQNLGTVVGGVMIGYSFWKVGKRLGNTNPIRKYLIMTAFGLILIFIITQGTLIMTSFPPFGLSSLSFVIISIYLFNFGFYAMAVSLSQDVKLRQTIKLKTKRNINLLSSIGKAQMTSELQRAVSDVKTVVEKEEKELEEKTGIETSLSEENIQDYMKQVLEEMGKSKKRSQGT
ncbi:MAG TPA: hypothetical protein VFC05_14220 [Nitrososphaeraceae archaeon]|jgi:hypothetical protein|nr:hypothetical protein [Nitrososphaeraceae archaeon]